MFTFLFENPGIYSSVPVFTVVDLPRWSNVEWHIFLSYMVFTTIIDTFQQKMGGGVRNHHQAQELTTSYIEPQTIKLAKHLLMKINLFYLYM